MGDLIRVACHGSRVSGYGLVYGRVNGFGHDCQCMLPSPLIAQLNGIIAFIHRGSVAVVIPDSLSVSVVLGGSSDPRVWGSSFFGRTNNSISYEVLLTGNSNM